MRAGAWRTRLASESQASSQLHLPAGVRRSDHATAGYTDPRAGLPEVRIVEKVPGIGADFHVEALAQPERLAQAEVDVAPVRAGKHVAARVAEGVRVGHGKRRGVE